MKEQPPLPDVGEIHRRVADAELIELVAEVGVAFHSQTDVIDRLGCAIDAVSLRADDVDERMAVGIEPVTGNALDGERSLAFLEIEDLQEEAPCRLQVPGSNGDVIEFHVTLLSQSKLEHSHSPDNRLNYEYTFRTFRMMILDNLALFLRIVEKGGLAAAGRELGLSAASVSERLVALEKYYGAALLHRTTRAINLTDEGRLLVQGARRLLAEADELESLIRLGVEKISGPIRLSAPIDLGRSYVVPTLDAFLAEHPEVTIDLNLTDGYVDLVSQGQDFAIRYGELADSTLRVKRLAENRRIVCAYPAYLETRGTPPHPDHLVHHKCLVMRYGLTTDRDWPFLIDGKERRGVVEGHRITKDGEFVRVLCLC